MIKEIYEFHNGKRCRRCGVGLWEMLFFRGWGSKKKHRNYHISHITSVLSPYVTIAFRLQSRETKKCVELSTGLICCEFEGLLMWLHRRLSPETISQKTNNYRNKINFPRGEGAMNHSYCCGTVSVRNGCLIREKQWTRAKRREKLWQIVSVRKGSDVI